VGSTERDQLLIEPVTEVNCPEISASLAIAWQ